MAINREAAELVGIPTTRMLAISVGLGVALAGVSGMLIGTLFPFTVLSGDSYTLKSFVVTVLGGFGNPVGALFAGVALGVLEGAVTPFVPVSWTLVIEFALFVLALIAFPGGLFTFATRSALMLLLRLTRRPFFWIIALVIAVFVIAPLIGDNVELRESLVLDALYITLASNLNIMLGYTGYINFGSIVFFGLGGYICLWLVSAFALPLGLSLLAAGVVREPAGTGFRARNPEAARPLLRPRHHRHHRGRSRLLSKILARGADRRASICRAAILKPLGGPAQRTVGHLFHHGRGDGAVALSQLCGQEF